MDKKGVDTRTVLWTFYILLVLIISYVLYTFIEDSASGKALKEKYFINDLGLNFDFLPSLNHDLEIKYNIEDDYKIQFSDGKITLIGKNLDYNYVQDENFDVPYREIEAKNGSKLIINKKDNTILINTKENEIK